MQKWRRAEFLARAAQFKRNYKNRIWTKLQFEGKYKCLDTHYKRLIKAYDRANYKEEVYMQTYWDSRNKKNLLLGKKLSHSQRVAVVTQAHKVAH